MSDSTVVGLQIMSHSMIPKRLPVVPDWRQLRLIDLVGLPNYVQSQMS